MEGYQSKRQYLRHIKKIAEIREGMGKLPVFHQNLNVTNYKSKERLLGTSSKSTLLSPLHAECKPHTSTQRIMRDFTVEKENLRLVSKILRMNSSIPLKQYEQQYENAKKCLQIRKRTDHHAYIYFKLYDINFLHRTSSQQDHYQISIVEGQNKTMLTKGTLFEIRKKELKIKKKPDMIIKIEGSNNRGKVRVTQQSLLDIRRRGAKVGHVVVEHVTK